MILFASLLFTPSSGWDLGSSWGDLDGWTQRLGLAFSDDCQESSGLAAIFAWAESWISGRRGRQRSAHCESREAACAAGVAATGLQVRSGHVRKGGNREWYDFKLRCGDHWQRNWLGLRYDIEGGLQEDRAAGVCEAGTEMSGVQVMRGRSGGSDSRDYYTFKLRCARKWNDALGLPFDGLRETRSATCPHGRSVSGIRVHRGFQDFGSVDTYEFQLQCLEDEETLESRAARAAASAGGATTLSELLSMGADEAWQLVNSLLAEPPTSVHATFDDTQSTAKRGGGKRARLHVADEL